ncbi:MAG: hypothetical protein R6V72_03580, partial [Cyclobacterium sp.]|uniref:hypothetical protein n=1 Tax=Cyclobacterium sp. TaxID=1966343 RepID=UPI003970F2AA
RGFIRCEGQITCTADVVAPGKAQSKRFAEKLSTLGVHLDTLFFPESYEPGLGHEYQFTFDEDGKQAFERSIQFINQVLSTKVGPDSPSMVPAY